jgi:hypothetical protein
MKSTLVFLLAMSIGLECQSQVFRNAGTLDPGAFSVGINPVIMFSPHNGTGSGVTYYHGNTGLLPGVDIGIKLMTELGWMLRLNPPHVWGFGADIRWSLYTGFPKVSFSAGFLKFGTFLLDGKLNVTLPLSSSISLFTGIEAWRSFSLEENVTLLWLPAGMEVVFLRKISFILEADFGINNKYDSFQKVGTGIRFYF